MKPKYSSRQHLGLIIVAFAAAGFSQSAHAANATWQGLVDTIWAGANWSATPVPGTGNTATFSGSSATVFGRTTIDLGAGATVGTVLFDTLNAAGYTIGSGAVNSQTLTLDATGAVTMNNTVVNNQLFNSAVTLATAAVGTTTFTNNSTTNSLTFAGNITGGTGGTAGIKTLAVAGAGNTTISGAIAAGGATSVALTKTGTGKLTLSSGSNAITGNVNIGGGSVDISGTLGTNTTSVNFRVGTVASTGAVLNILSGAVINNRANLFIGDAGAGTGGGAVYQSGGSLTLTQAANVDNLRIGSNAGGYGYYKLSGGSITANEIGIGGSLGGTIGVVDVTGGTFTSNGYLAIGRGTTTSSGLLNVTGGTVEFGKTLGTGPLDLNWGNTSGALAVVNVGGGAGSANVTGVASNVASGSFSGKGLNLAASNTAGTSGIANLLTNGTLTVSDVVSSNGTSNAYFNFNGGTLKAAATNTGANFLTGTNIDAVNVYSSGGTINNNSTAVTVGAALVAPAGFGVSGTSVSVPAGGTGYIGAPLVTLSGGTGTGATGYATISGGVVTGIVITSPGTGYTSGNTLTATFSGGGAATAATTVTGITVAANTSGGMIFTGGGSTTLTNTSTYGGSTQITGGTLALSGTGAINSTSSIIISGSGAKFLHTGSVAGTQPITLTQGTLDGTGTVGAVTVGAGTGGIVANGNATTAKLTMGSLTFSGAGAVNLNLLGGGSTTTEGLIVSGALQTSGTANSILVNITPTSPLALNTAYNLVKYGSYSSGTFADFTYGGNTSRKIGTFANDTVNKYITLTVAGDTPKWTGVDNSNWIVGTTGGIGNWKLVTANTATDYIQGDDVLFDDTASNKSVIISAANVSPASTTFNNSTGNDYTLSGGFGIAGSGPLVKNGTGKVTITTTNTFNGPTTIGAGIMELGDGTTNGSIASTTGVSNSGTLAYNSVGTQTAGYAISGTGAVTKAGAGAVTLSGVNTYSGGTTLNAGTLTAGSTTAFGATASTLTINGGSLDSSVVNLTLANNNAQNWNGDFTFTGTNSLNLGTGAVTLGGNRQVTVTANTLTEGGAIGGGFSLTKAGAGTLALLSANTYSGGTTINGGTLAVGGTLTANSGALGSAAVVVNTGGALRAGYAVASVATAPVIANDITLAGGSIFADDAFQHLGGAVNVTAASTLGSTYNSGANSATEGNKGLFLDGIVSGSANLTLQQSGYSTGNAYNTSIVYFTNAANTYSGTVTVTPMAGTNTTSGGSFLGLNASTALQFATVNLNGNSAGLRFGNSPIVFNTGLGTATLGALSGSGNVVLTGYNQTTHVYGADSIALTAGGNNTTTTYSGVMSGAGSLTKTGSGTMTLGGLNSFTGNIVISNGTLAAGTGITGDTAAQITSNLGDLGTAVTRSITINNGGTLSLTGGNTLGTGASTGTLAGVTLVVNSGGTFQTGSNAAGAGWWNKIGAVNLNGGAIHVGSGANNTNFQGLALIGTVTVGGSTASVIDNLGSSDSAFNAIHLGQNAAVSQVVNFNVSDVTGDSATDLTVSAKLINTSANLVASGLQKTGSGTMTLSGANAYTGTTTVSAGKLVVNGNISTSSLTTVSSTGTLGGAGTVGALTVLSGGMIAPGNSPGILSSGNTDLQAGSTLSIELNGITVGTDYDQLNVTGTLSLAGDLSLSLGYSPVNSTLFFILANDGADAITGTFSNASTDGGTYAFGGQDFQISYFGDSTGGTFTGGNDVVLMAVPEPGAALLGGIGVILLLRRRRN